MSDYLWDIRETCCLSLNKQLSPEWSQLRTGRGTMSLAAAMAGHIPAKIFEDFYGSDEKLAEIILGVSDKSFSRKQESVMKHGQMFEPFVRDWYSKEILNIPITEVGLAIWKKDQRFGGSLDGEFIIGGVEHGLEIKSPQKMYRQLVEYSEAFKKGYLSSPGDHIFRSHYDQMVGNGIITNKKFMHYVVMSPTKEVYWENFLVDVEYWEKDLYPNMRSFYDKYVEPLLTKSKIKRIDVHI
jgi:hypothetical protein